MTVFAAATGIGSWPGRSVRAAAEIIVGELHRLPYLPELPDRGIGADMIGRAGALLVDIAIDTVPRGYRLVARPGAVNRRSVSLLGEDLDALEEAWVTAGGTQSGRSVKVQCPGPVTLAAMLELANGHRAITDRGAVRDLTTSLAEGVALHRTDLERRLSTTVVIQLDEPLLPAALAGRLAGTSFLTPVHPVDESSAVALLDECVTTVGGEVLVHCGSGDIPWEVLHRSAVRAVSVDPAALDDRGRDGLGGFIDSGRTAVLGVVPAASVEPVPSYEQAAAAAAAVTDRLGFPRSVLAERVGLSPVGGLVGATAAWARTATVLTQRAGDALIQDPAAV
ncbi:MAG: methionine synthase [Mycobacterium sp.]|nr:methionine synthase [Mycobacterium sp.]